MIQFQTSQREAFTLVMAMGASDEATRDQLNQFLARANVTSPQLYFSQIVVTQHGTRNVTYLHFAEVPSDLKAPVPLKVLPIPACLVATFSVTKEELSTVLEGSLTEEFQAYLKAQGVKSNLFVAVLASWSDDHQHVHFQIPYKKV